ncbi:hypothetical protein [Plantactinospora sp. KLBMP9567]|uniref:hypothetical protein n=1 Tax=Plantactinospora sp. KLBMP9567 TaxID=3085900 RepID=UPI0029814AFA|nr:hypothetical protein [Plantactinospora sp. KLBMP9567]
MGSLAALVSAIVTMTAVWLLLDGQSAWTKGLVVFAGTVIGAAAGSWWSQPLMAQLLDRG